MGSPGVVAHLCHVMWPLVLMVWMVGGTPS